MAGAATIRAKSNPSIPEHPIPRWATRRLPDDGAVPPRDATADVNSIGDATADSPALNEEASVESGASEGGDAAPDSGPQPPQPVSPYIVVDQFGYPTAAAKFAVVRNPQSGFDFAATPFAPGATYAVVDAHTNQKVFEGSPGVWNGGNVDTSSGDAAWWFDFSSVTTAGDYFVLDESKTLRSNVFRIANDVYSGVLVQATRMLYYQRDGIAKTAAYAGADWADGQAHLQDATCGPYPADAGAPHDLHGGWYDAGDQSKYVNFAASNVITLLRAYAEHPTAFTDNTNIPESGNGVPDVLDEAKWALDWIARMQAGASDGAVLSLVSHNGASPPSADTSPCVYGPASTSASLSAAASFAYASIVFAKSTAATTAYPGYAAALSTKAQSAWTWASTNPGVTFFSSPAGLGSREQELSDAARLDKAVQAATFLFELTGGASYQTFVDANYAQVPSTFDPYNIEPVETLLEYATHTNATSAIAASIVAAFLANANNLPSQTSQDPYLAYVPSYPVGSNGGKAGQGNLFYDFVSFGVVPDDASDPPTLGMAQAAENYVHYLHGVNPLQLVYLSNMGDYGAERYVTRFFSLWFVHGSKWDAFGVSQYGPPPGFLVGGANPSYTWDSCCPLDCGNPTYNALCGSAPPSPPSGQPPQKSYKDFNNNWPLDSWQVSEPHDVYQTQYIRLLSKFLP